MIYLIVSDNFFSYLHVPSSLWIFIKKFAVWIMVPLTVKITIMIFDMETVLHSSSSNLF